MAHFLKIKKFKTWVVDVAQLVELLVPISEIRGSKPVNGKIYIENLFTVNCIEDTKIEKKRPEWGLTKKVLI